MSSNNVPTHGIKEGIARLSPLVKTTQFLWFAGHATMTICALIYVISFTRLSFAYSLAFIGAISSYGLVVYLSHQPFQITLPYIIKVVNDDNFAYLSLAVIWLVSGSLLLTIIPFAIYSFFHSIGYLRSTILPTAFPFIQSEITNHSSTPSVYTKIAKYLDTIKEKYYVIAVQFAAQTEAVYIPITLIFGLFVGANSIFIIFMYYQFLRLRILKSPQTILALQDFEKQMDGFLLKPTIPAMVQTIYLKLKDFIKSLNPRQNTQVPQSH